MSRVLAALVPLALVLSLLGAPASVPAPEAEPVADFTAAASAPTFADPHWYPLRRDAKLRCVYSQCIGTPEYPALDLASARNVKGEPVHAAGRGIFHVGDTGNGCFNGDQASDRGNWAWIDHGGGVVSRYHHLETLRTSLEGQIVGPGTMIGTMGQSGSKCGDTFYLHFETRRGGVNGQVYPRHPGILRICTPARTFYPRALGESRWDDLKRDTIVPGGTTDCYTNPTTPSPPDWVLQARGTSWARLRWPARRGITGTTVQRQEFQVAANRWGLDTYRYHGPSATETVWKDVRSMRKYRARAAYRNAYGHSVWSPWRYLVGPPRVPRFREISATSSRVIYRWYKPLHNGLEVSSYTAAIRPKINGTWRRWSYKSVPVTSTSVDWTSPYVVPGRTYAVRVRANAGRFSSAYNSVRTITARR